MKVPSYPVGQTRPSSQGLSYLRPADTGQIVQAWSGVARGLAGIGEAYQQREDQDARFKALNAFNEFQIKIDEDLTNEKRDSQPGDSNFLDRAQTHYQNREDEFIAQLPADMQEEFKVRAGQVKQRVFGDSLDFQYKSQDLYYRLEIDKAYEAAKNGLGLSGDPKQLDQWRKGLFEEIDESSLVPLEKEKLKHDMSLGLVGVAYMKDGEKRKLEEQSTPKTPVDTARAKQLEFSMHELKTTEKAAGNRLAGARTLEEAVDAGLAYERPSIPARANRLRNAAAVLAGKAPKGAMQARAYFESQGLTPVQASGFVGSLMQESGLGLDPGAANPDDPGTSIGIAQWNRERKAAMLAFTGQPGVGDTASKASGQFASLDADPAYADLPYETRLALQQDIVASVNRTNSARSAAEKAAHDEFMNTTLLRVHDDPNFGHADIDQLYADGKIPDYEDLTKLEKAVDDRDKDEMNLLRAREKFNSTAIYNPNSDEDRKGLDLIVGEAGLASLSKGDQKYFKEQFLPIIDRANDVPTSAAGLFIGLSRSSDPKMMNFALDAMAQIQDISPAAFAQRFGPQETADVNLWNSHKGLYTQEELFNIIRGGVTQEARQRNEALRTEGEKIVADPKRAPNFVDVLEAADVSILPNTVPDVYAPAGAKMVAQNEFNTLFVDEYARTGDIELATSNATAVMMRNWGVTNVGGQNLFMKFPPEKVGVPMFEGSYDWADKQLRDKLKLPADEAYQLFSDDVTQSEWDKYRQGKGPSPSYQVIRWKNGLAYVATDQPRVWFEPPVALIQREKAIGDLKLLIGERDRFLTDVYSREFARSQDRMQSGEAAAPVDPEIQRAMDELNARVEEREKQVYPEVPRKIPDYSIRNKPTFGVKP
jgi:hypothetical protein